MLAELGLRSVASVTDARDSTGIFSNSFAVPSSVQIEQRGEHSGSLFNDEVDDGIWMSWDVVGCCWMFLEAWFASWQGYRRRSESVVHYRAS